MIYSDAHKLELSGWLQTENESAYNSSLKLQKFLFLYESFSVADGETANFTSLKGYERGPVFSNVWGDYTHERMDFDEMALDAYNKNQVAINQKRAKRSSFIVSILTEPELSALTHQMNIWKVKEDAIKSGAKHIALYSSDFNDHDKHLAKTLEMMYPDELIENSKVLSVNGYYFVFSKEDFSKLQEKDEDILATLAENEDLHNPVFVERDADGRLLID